MLAVQRSPYRLRVKVGMAQRDDVGTRGRIGKGPERTPAQRLDRADKLRREPLGVVLDRFVAQCVETGNGLGEPDRGGIGERGLFEPASARSRASMEGVEREWPLGAHPAQPRRQLVE